MKFIDDLNLCRKKHLLAFVAAITFDRGDYFFEKNTVQQLIADYLANLPDATSDPVNFESDSEVVLKAIEAQHGLLVERARGIYSFSHLTFQEYFTAREIVNNSDSTSFGKTGQPPNREALARSLVVSSWDVAKS
jgi:predicted NACHT family NTPase